MQGLYPEIKPYARHELAVDAVHTLYIEECGTEEGIPVLFVHGGPGAGCEKYHRQFFDPTIYRIILFDQRGCGRSTPHASLDNNTTAHLLADMEAIRKHLGIKQWVIFGGSWGATLGLVYAETHPDRTLALILRGIFLCRPEEIGWFYREGANRIFPDYWQDFIAPIPENERHDLLRAHYKRLIGNDEIARMASAKAWALWEGRASNLMQKKAVVDFFGSPRTALSLARIEAHYFVHDSFLEKNQILDNIDSIKDIPGFIVHGRYDIVCPLVSAWELYQAWPASEFFVVPGAGHSATEHGTIAALVNATQRVARQLKNK